MTGFSTRNDQEAQTPKPRCSALKMAGSVLVIFLLAVSCLYLYAKSKDMYGGTRLILASSKGQSAIVKILILAGVDVNAKDNNNRTALAFAARQGKQDCVNALIAAHADVNEKSCNGMTALMMAAATGNYECVKVLISAGADLNAEDKDGNTALNYANDACDALDDPSIEAGLKADGAKKVEALKAAGAKTNDANPTSGRDMLMVLMKSSGASDK